MVERLEATFLQRVNFMPDPSSSASIAEQYAVYEDAKFWFFITGPYGVALIVFTIVILVSGFYLWHAKATLRNNIVVKLEAASP